MQPRHAAAMSGIAQNHFYTYGLWHLLFDTAIIHIWILFAFLLQLLPTTLVIQLAG